MLMGHLNPIYRAALKRFYANANGGMLALFCLVSTDLDCCFGSGSCEALPSVCHPVVRLEDAERVLSTVEDLHRGRALFESCEQQRL